MTEYRFHRDKDRLMESCRRCARIKECPCPPLFVGADLIESGE